MRRWRYRVMVGAAVAGATLLGGQAPAQAADGGLAVSVRADDPLAPVVVLANKGSEPCQVAITSLGTVTFTEVTQGGTPVVPVVFEPGFNEPLDAVIAARLRTL